MPNHSFKPDDNLFTRSQPPPYSVHQHQRHQRHTSGRSLVDDISLERIVRGDTKSPVAKADLIRWLRWKSRISKKVGDGVEEELGIRVVDFLLAVEVYKGLFGSLPPEKASLSLPPFQAISQLSLQHPDIMKPDLAKINYGQNALAGDLYDFGGTSSDGSGHGRDISIDSFESWSSGTTLTNHDDRPGIWRSNSAPRSATISSLKSPGSTVHGQGLSRITSPSNTISKSERNFRLPTSGARTRAQRPGMISTRPASTASDDSSYESDSYLVRGLGSVKLGSGASERLKPIVERPFSPFPLSKAQPPSSPLSPLSVKSALLVDPATLPLHTHLASLTARFLTSNPTSVLESDHSLARIQCLTSLVPSVLLSTFQSESQITTHPEVLAPIAKTLEAWFTSTHLPLFLEDSIRNLHRHTALGRLLVGLMCTVLAIGAEILLLLDPSPFQPDGLAIQREWRLLLLPILLGGIGYGMGARAGMCFWLALFGVREEPYDADTAPSLSKIWRSLIDRKQHRSGVQRKLRKRAASYKSDTLELFPSHPQMGRSRSASNATISSQSTAGDGRTSTNTSILVLLWRLTGTAWGVKRVHDPVLRRYQRRHAWKIAGWLVLVLVVLGVAICFVPYIHLE